MRKLLILILLFVATQSFAQYNNEWIDHSKTYYKFKIGSTGLYRINQTTLPVSINTTPAEQFQLWRNGKQVPLYTSVASGALGATGYIEFWGEKNDGVPDKALYRNPAHQLSDRISLETDTASYFLTVNTNSAENLRFAAGFNNVSNPNNLPVSPYFMHTARVDLKNMINRGLAYNAGDYVYSSAYDEGEWWSSNEFLSAVLPSATSTGAPAQPLNVSLAGLKPYTSGPASSLRMSVAGSAPNTRNIKATLNGSTIFNNQVSFFAATVMNGVVTTSTLTDNSQLIVSSEFTTTVAADRAVAGFIELFYPRLWDFNGSSNFTFSLQASPETYIEISNFNNSGIAPVLYDLTNNLRYVGDISVAGKIRFVLPGGDARNFVLVSEANANINTVTQFQQKVFTNFSLAANQGDYLIITHSSLRAGGDAVNQYSLYRSSANGGSYNSKIYDIDELVDQFAFGIKRHPSSVKNFIRWARNNFTNSPKDVFIIGHGVTYDEANYQQNHPDINKLALVPTFGFPGSDILLAAEGHDPVPLVNIGRLSAIRPSEITDYLQKMQEYESAQRSTVQTIDNKAWMKNIVHVVGANDPSLDTRLTNYFRSYENVIRDTLFGAKVTTFSKTTSGPATTLVDAQMTALWQQGISIINYFGHSSATTLDYNLQDPSAYNNQGKYPMFIANGCNAGNFFSFDLGRLTFLPTLSEKYVLAPQRGTIGFIASTHFGFENYLDYYNQHLYKAFANLAYNKPIGDAMKDAINGYLSFVGYPNAFVFLDRIHAEQTLLHGDPALKINAHNKPDYVIEEPQVHISPTFISIADTAFTVKAYFYNIGKATKANDDSVSVQFRRQYPDGTVATVLTKKLKAIRYIDSIVMNLPIVPTRDKGNNNLTITIDNDFKFDELSEANNTITKSFVIYEDEVRPVYPYNFSIINKSTSKLVASTANPLAANRTYTMEIDTTELFNSSFKVTRTLTSVGGLLEFEPGITYQDSTVYYWRVGLQTSTGMNWNTSSFTYLPGSNVGYNQSHFYQHTKSQGQRIFIDTSSRRWTYTPTSTNFFVTHRVGTFNPQDMQIAVNGLAIIKDACIGRSVMVNVFEPNHMKPLYNQANPNMSQTGALGGFMGSGSYCGTGREYNFEFNFWDTVGRRKIRDFMDWVPNGHYVMMRLWGDDPNLMPLINEWKNDQNVYGVGNSLYDRLRSAGFDDLDSFNRARIWFFIYKKNDNGFVPVSKFSEGMNDFILYNFNLDHTDSIGAITSPKFGPAAAWREIHWRGNSLENPTQDQYSIEVIGISNTGAEATLFTLSSAQQDFNISSINATQYPYIKLRMSNKDATNFTPYQLRFWRLYYTPVPEGGLAPNLKFTFKDTLDLGEPLVVAIPFKNVSDVAFANTIKVNVTITDRNNQQTITPAARLKALVPNDTAMTTYQISTQGLAGANTLQIDVNPADDQPEQTHFNNFLYKNFFVKGDTYNPYIDVTFDGVHILNNDIVSAKPHVLVKLKDEAKYMALDDTSLITLYLKYPDNTVRRFKYGTDTLKFNPASPGGDNVASADFIPTLTQDGTYELTVRGKDKSGNNAGTAEYRVSFQVYNKPMISNMFNYPNPFTTSTAFVFTVTGSQVPQNIKIQILTVTGKIVREITKDELGPIHIGRNITEFKWDGTDQYGQKLANGVYLYRVVTNLNGNGLEKFPTFDSFGDTIDTDKYFNKGYGKMYLMR